MPDFKLVGEGAQRRCKALAGEVEAADTVEDMEAPLLGDEFEAAGAVDGVPAEVVVAFLEAFGGSASAEDGHEFGAVRLGLDTVDSLLKDMAGEAFGHEVVALVEDLAAVADLSFSGGGAQDEVVTNEGGLGHQCFRGRLKLQKQGWMFGFFSKRQ